MTKIFTFIIDPNFDLKEVLTPRFDSKRKLIGENTSLYFLRSVGAYQRLMTNTRYQIFFTVRDKKPESLYALAKILGKELSNLLKDIRVLEAMKLIELESITTGTGRSGQKPRAIFEEIEVKIKGTLVEDVA